jgi:phospholipid/cholesterol/gamma-HCH transport system substrate-binding protein
MKWRRRRTGFEHGTLLAGSVALLGLLVLAMGTPRNWWTRTLELRFRTNSAAGLQPGMAVKIAGYRVGQVDRIQLLNDARVQVTLSIAASREGLIGRRSRATLAQDGLLGSSYIAISPDLRAPGQRQALKAGDTLSYDASPDLGTLLREVAASRLPLQNLIGRSVTLIDERLPRSLNQLDRTLGSGERLAGAIQGEARAGSGLLQARISRVSDSIEQSLSSLEATLQDVRVLVRSSDGLLRGIQRSWLLQLLEPAAEGVSPTPATPAEPTTPPAGATPASESQPLIGR